MTLLIRFPHSTGANHGNRSVLDDVPEERTKLAQRWLEFHRADDNAHLSAPMKARWPKRYGH